MSANPNNLILVRSTIPGKGLPNRRELLWLNGGKVCHWCGKPTRLCAELDPDQATIEHIIPRCKGGTNEPENLASSCRLCNSRRSYEDQMGLKEGSLLGMFPVTPKQKKMFGHTSVHPQGRPNIYRHIALTGDEKKAIMGKHNAEDVLREQRDQGLKEIASLRKIIEDQEKQLKALKSITLWKFIRKRLSEWIRP